MKRHHFYFATCSSINIVSFIWYYLFAGVLDRVLVDIISSVLWSISHPQCANKYLYLHRENYFHESILKSVQDVSSGRKRRFSSRFCCCCSLRFVFSFVNRFRYRIVQCSDELSSYSFGIFNYQFVLEYTTLVLSKIEHLFLCRLIAS